MAVIHSVLVLTLVGLLVGPASVVSADSSLTFFVGQTATIPCSTLNDEDVSWTHSQTGWPVPHTVYAYGQVVNGYRNRNYVDRSVKRQFNLVIKNIQFNDAGLYLCVDDEGLGDKITVANLIVVSPDVASTEAGEPIAETTRNNLHQSSFSTFSTSRKEIEWTTIVIIIIATLVSVTIVLTAIIVVYRIRHRSKKDGTDPVTEIESLKSSAKSDTESAGSPASQLRKIKEIENSNLVLLAGYSSEADLYNSSKMRAEPVPPRGVLG